MKKYSRSITGAVVLISFTTILARGIGFIREVIFANTFGLSKEYEVYLIAAVLPVLINTAIYYLAQNYFIPLYNKLSDPNSRQVFVSQQFWLFIFLGAVLSVISFLFKDLILVSYVGENGEILKLADKVFLIYILSFPVNAGFSILTAYMQSEMNFKHPAFAQLLLNLPIIALVLFFHEFLLVLAIPIGYIVGNILQLSYLVFIIGPATLRLNFRDRDWKIKTAFNGSLIIVILIEVINQLHPFIDRYFFDKVEQGGIASLSYAGNIFGLPVTIFSFALASVMFPLLSKYTNSETPEKSEEFYYKSLKMLTIAFIPISLIFIFNSELIISLVYQRGKFNFRDTSITSMVLKMYSFSLVFYSAYAVINKMIFSAGLLRQLLLLSIMLMILKIIMNGVLVDELEQNGLAISSSCTYILLSAGGYFLVSRKLTKGKKRLFPKYIIVYALLGLSVFFISRQIMWVTGVGEIIQVLLFSAIYAFSIWFIDYPFFDLK